MVSPKPVDTDMPQAFRVEPKCYAAMRFGFFFGYFRQKFPREDDETHISLLLVKAVLILKRIIINIVAVSAFTRYLF